ncbi:MULTISPECIES: hypothetical protein [Pseudomonas]|jgi:hypothetical protein|uniref:Uncharacterized protein n=1 Tax=Pseudomonas frederiksbergensis TaxID=104087 RepID=A0A6L5C276_9PSED|nr:MULTISPECIES: hypothetical protein [Pseudomonas]KAF2394718.1 hypothetical protein FX983_02700 [Pseudomonas frederiksbergensis]MDN3221126.1 hypothetical protein [Pseudomonas nunensis]UZE14719.1 hypothetical protein LOY68_14295 [Pseudomonas sp. B21-053]
MSAITKSQLAYTYSWSADSGDNPHYIGKPDQDKVDRNEGYEVLRFLNSICSEKAQALNAERLIKTKLPDTVHKRSEILKWLIDNWQK